MLFPLALATLAPPQFALQFDGNSLARIPDCAALRFESEFTLEAWIFVDEEARKRTFGCIFSKNYEQGGYELTLVDRPHLRLHGTDSKVPHGQKGVVPSGRWVHVAYARSLRKAVFYINGKPTYEVPTGVPILANDLPLGIGSSNNLIDQEGKACAFIGKIDEIKIWSVARSAGNIRKDMHRAPSPKHPSLVAYFGFNQAPTTLVPNLTGKTGSLELGVSGNGMPNWVQGIP